MCASRFELPLLGSNQDPPDPESGVLPVTPRGSVYGAEGARTPDLLGAIQALSQLSYSPGAYKLITFTRHGTPQRHLSRHDPRPHRTGLRVAHKPENHPRLAAGLQVGRTADSAA